MRAPTTRRGGFEPRGLGDGPGHGTTGIWYDEEVRSVKIMDKARRAVLDWLRVQPAQERSINLVESVGFAGNVIRNKVWYRGDPSELSQLAKQIGGAAGDDTARTRFWAQVPDIGSIRKAHAGLPAVMADTLSYIVKADLDGVDFDGHADAQARWDAMAEDNDFKALVGQAITDTLVSADGAFKVSIDSEVSDQPLLEFWPADRVEYERKRGRIVAVVFVSLYEQDNGKKYTLRERYAPGCVTYELYDSDGNPRELVDLPELAGLRDAYYGGDFMLAVPLEFFKSSRYPGRGRSIYDNKIDAFDALDEVVSQWIDAIRAGRVLRYIPDNMVPRNFENGTMTSLSYFTSNFVVTAGSGKETVQDKMEMQQAEINYDAFVASYSAALDMCLQGIMSPATLGVDVGKMASADAQREKKDVTGYTRNAITDALERVLPQVAVVMLMADDLMQGRAAGVYELPTVSFGEYGAPDFDSRVQTLATARTAGLMSLEAMVDELWGGSKTDAERAEEVARLQREQGLDEEPEPLVGADALV